MDNANVIVLIPAWNEGSRIKPILEVFLDQFPVLVVDDGSNDDTAAVAREVGVDIVIHPQNMGKGVALSTGFDWALERGYDAVLTLDADGQHDPEEAPKFIEAYERGEGDLIIGRRDFRAMPLYRAFGNGIGTWMLSNVLGTKIYDNQCGYRLYTRKLLETVDLERTGFEFEVEVVVEAVAAGMKIGWVDVRTIYGIDKKSYFHPFHDSVKFLDMVRVARKRFQELKKNQSGRCTKR
ncbi:MAG TPA: glycosyltransferase family 2 protein [Anaerolineales bacterium]|nr:glycosyltransferase family 2 protein [Anaerolineales bacterium]